MTITDLELQLLDLIDKIAHFFDGLKIAGYNILTWLWWLVTQCGGSIVIIVLIMIIYWCIDKEKGEKISFTIFSSFCINGMMKSLINRPRPFEIEEGKYAHVRKMNESLDHATGTSFPSGHSQNTLTTYGSITLHDRSKASLSIFIILGLLVPFSRLYLGVHYLSDVLVGSIIGMIIAFGLFLLLKYCYRHKYIIYLGILVLILPFMFIENIDNTLLQSFGLLGGFILGIFIENKFVHYTTDVPVKNKLLRMLIGLICVSGIYLIYYFVNKAFVNADLLILGKVFTTFIHFVLSLSIFGIIPLMFKKEDGRRWL